MIFFVCIEIIFSLSYSKEKWLKPMMNAWFIFLAYNCHYFDFAVRLSNKTIKIHRLTLLKLNFSNDTFLKSKHMSKDLIDIMRM